MHAKTKNAYIKIAERITELRKHWTGAPNDSFLLNSLKTLFRLSRVLLDLLKCILSGAKKFISVRSS